MARSAIAPVQKQSTKPTLEGPKAQIKDEARSAIAPVQRRVLF